MGIGPVLSYNYASPVALSDTVNYPDVSSKGPALGLWVSGTGSPSVSVTLPNGTSVTAKVAAGTLLPVTHTRVNQTGTTAAAADLLALWVV